MSDASRSDPGADSDALDNTQCKYCGSVIGHSHKKRKTKGDADKQARKPRKTMAKLEEDSVRQEVRVSMIAAIPGVSPTKAAAILDSCDGSFARLMDTTEARIANSLCGGAPLGTSIGRAVWRALH